MLFDFDRLGLWSEQGERLQQWRTAMRQNRNSRRKWIDKANVCTNPTIMQNDQALTSTKRFCKPFGNIGKTFGLGQLSLM